jgi:hypothetical protein
MFPDIRPPFSDLTGIAHIAVDPQPSWLTVAFAQASFQRILLASAPLTPLLGAAMDGVSRLLVRDAGFRHTSPTARRAGQPSGASSTSGRRRPPARFAAFAVICSEISAAVGFVRSTLPPIISSQEHIMRSWQFSVASYAGKADFSPFDRDNRVCRVHTALFQVLVPLSGVRLLLYLAAASASR